MAVISFGRIEEAPRPVHPDAASSRREKSARKLEPPTPDGLQPVPRLNSEENSEK